MDNRTLPITIPPITPVSWPLFQAAVTAFKEAFAPKPAAAQPAGPTAVTYLPEPPPTNRPPLPVLPSPAMPPLDQKRRTAIEHQYSDPYTNFLYQTPVSMTEINPRFAGLYDRWQDRVFLSAQNAEPKTLAHEAAHRYMYTTLRAPMHEFLRDTTAVARQAHFGPTAAGLLDLQADAPQYREYFMEQNLMGKPYNKGQRWDPMPEAYANVAEYTRPNSMPNWYQQKYFPDLYPPSTYAPDPTEWPVQWNYGGHYGDVPQYVGYQPPRGYYPQPKEMYQPIMDVPVFWGNPAPIYQPPPIPRTAG